MKYSGFRVYRIVLVFGLFFLSFHLSGQKYVLVWNDEFNNPGLPDSTKWGYEKGLVRNSELQFYTEKRIQNARIEDTVLILEARKENYNGAGYTSASIRSKGIGDWTYGKIEIRAKVPTGKGTWPALWMMPTYSVYGGWPKSGEIDIMEYIGVEPEKLHYTCHFEGTNGSGHQSSGKGLSSIANPFNKFIVFTLVWTPDKMEWFANGAKTHEYVRNSTDYRVWPFNKEFYLILNLAYGGSWGGYAGVDDTKLPHKFLIDYVRVYKIQDSPAPFLLEIPGTEGGKVEITPQLKSYPEGTEVTLNAVPDKDYIFKSWKHFSGANPYKFTISKNTYIEPLFTNPNELITNQNFNLGWTPWSFYVSNSQTSSYSAAIENGEFAMNITKSPGVDWQLGFQESGLSMRKGNYKLGFEAYASQQKQLLITVSKNYPDWGEHLNKRLTISTTKTKYELILKMPKDDDNVRLYFGLGNFLGKFSIDNVSLSRIVETPTKATTWEIEINDKVFVYPNPVHDQYTVRIPETMINEKPVLNLIDFMGKVLLKRQLEKPETLFDSKNLENGVYFIQINSVQSKIEKQLIIMR